MKLRNKVLTAIALTWLSFLAITYAGANNLNFMPAYLALGIVFACVMIYLLNKLVVSRLERLDKEITYITKHREFSNRVHINGSAEFTRLSLGINSLLENIQHSQFILEERIRERTSDLIECNNKLQKEISNRRLTEKELITHQENLTRLAHYDTLTSLPNRIFFNEILNKTLNHSQRHNKSFAILFLDLDRFKAINDTFGHTYGDMVLKEIAKRFSGALRAGDILARLGGDEFIILLNDLKHPKFAVPVAEKLIQACADPVVIGTQEFYLTASIGVCIYPNDGKSLEDLQRHADIAMYKAKRNGGNIYEFFTKAMNLAVSEQAKFEMALRKALRNNEFILYYQPKINVKTGKLDGVEALVRWDNPELGVVGPTKFLPSAEESGLIVDIGEWVLKEACEQNKKWQNQGYIPNPVSVNLSLKQFQSPNIISVIENILHTTQLTAEYLELEMTEETLLEDMDLSIDRLHQLKSLGVKISIDDFGVGLTSIRNLKKLPIDILKIDQSFMKGIPFDVNNIAMTSAVIAMAHSFDFHVVAEGVETLEQVHFLAQHQCDVLQGYYISRPLPANKIILQFTKINSPNINLITH